MLNRRCSWLHVLLPVLLSTSPASAEEAVWEMDSFSFFHSEDAGAISSVPIGNLPVTVSGVEDGRWTVTLPIASIAPVSSYGGLQLNLRMPGNATGTIIQQQGEFSVQLQMSISIDAATSPPTTSTLEFAFTTGTVSIPDGNGGFSTVSGVALDGASGFVQLVSGQSAPTSLPLMGGKPFYVILSGRIVGLPDEIASSH